MSLEPEWFQAETFRKQIVTDEFLGVKSFGEIDVPRLLMLGRRRAREAFGNDLRRDRFQGGRTELEVEPRRIRTWKKLPSQFRYARIPFQGFNSFDLQAGFALNSWAVSKVLDKHNGAALILRVHLKSLTIFSTVWDGCNVVSHRVLSGNPMLGLQPSTPKKIAVGKPIYNF